MTSPRGPDRSGRTRRVAFLVAPGSHSLELSGPYDAFVTAAREAARPGSSPAYRVEVVALAAGPIPTVKGQPGFRS